TDIYNYMRRLWALVGVPNSPATDLPISAQTVSQMVDRTMALPEGTRLYLLAPVVRGRKGEYRRELAEWQKAGFTRVRIDGVFHEIEDAPALEKNFKHDIEVVVDRLIVRPGIETRLADSLEQALKLADGLVYLDPADPNNPSPSGEGQVVGEVGEPGTASAISYTAPTPNPSPEGEGLREARTAFTVPSELDEVEGPNTAAIEAAGADNSTARTGVAKALEDAHERNVLAT